VSTTSINGEWNAWLTRSLVLRRPRSASPASAAAASSSVARTATMAPPAGSAHQRAPRGDQRRRVWQREDPGNVRGGDFADGMARQIGRHEAEGLQQPEHRDIEREDRGLGEVGTVQQRAADGDHLAQRALQVLDQVPARLAEGTGERRERRAELLPHPRPLRALPGEQGREP
jgi:hypothetical protein